MENGKESIFAFSLDAPCLTSSPKMPESSIGYKEPLLLGWMRERSLSVVGKY